LQCSFCEVWKHQNRKEDELTIDQIERIFSKLQQIDVLRISGGEPFLRGDLAAVVNTIDAVAKPRMIHFTTNGVLTEDIVAVLTRIQHPEKIHIKVSLDALGERHDELRGVDGTYSKVVATLSALAELRKALGFHLGINATIASASDIARFYDVKEFAREMAIPVYGVIASDPVNALYSNRGIVDPENSIKTPEPFSLESLETFFSRQLADAKRNSNLFERIVDTYHIRGLQNRLLHKIKNPHPRCVALTSHLRILPNGDIPTCLYNSTVVGNLLENSLDDVWFQNESMQKARAWVNACGGCWQSCESIVNAIYTGDIWRGIL